jgi:hypothetical protein
LRALAGRQQLALRAPRERLDLGQPQQHTEEAPCLRLASLIWAWTTCRRLRRQQLAT